MRCARHTDSVGGAKWLRRAETLAKGIRNDPGVKREIMDGYLVEGKRAGKNRRATVIDLPGRFVFFESTSVAIGLPGSGEAPWPQPQSAPQRAVMIEQEAPHADGSAYALRLSDPPGSNRPAYAIGAPPVSATRSVGISSPAVSGKWIAQTRTVCPASDPLPPVDAGDPATIDYSGISDVWVLVDAFPVGAAGQITLVINEQNIVAAFGMPIIRRTVVPYWRNSDTRAWSVVVSSTRVVVFLWLSDSAAPVGDTAAIGVMVCEENEDGWSITGTRRIDQSELQSPLLFRHARVTSSGVPTGEYSTLRPRVMGVGTDGQTATLLTTVRHELDAYANLQWSTPYGSMVVSAVLRIDVVGTDVFVTASDVQCDAALSSGVTALANNLATTNGVVVSQAVTDWSAPRWPVYCGLVDGVREVRGYALGIREPGQIFLGSYWRGPHVYAAQVLAMTLDGREVRTNDLAFNPMTEPGSRVYPSIYPPDYTGAFSIGMEDGGNDAIPAALTHAAEQVEIELPLYAGGTHDRVIGRFKDGASRTPLPAGAQLPRVSCYAMEQRDPDGAVIRQARTMATYRVSGVTTVELRYGDTVFAAGDTTQRIAAGAFYIGNPAAQMIYGKMGDGYGN